MRGGRMLWGVLVCASMASELAFAQRVTLRIRPHVGDTLCMRMDQRFELSNDSSSVPPPEPMAPMVASMHMFTRAVVQRSTPTATELFSITDSVLMMPPSTASVPLFAQIEHALLGHALRLRVGNDGEISFIRRDQAQYPARGEGGRMPAILPQEPVAVGESWKRNWRVPLSTAQEIPGLAQVTFHLDSLGPEGTIAYISMRGTFSHQRTRQHGHGLAHQGAGDRQAIPDQTVGTIMGTMQIDRRLVWMTDSHMMVDVRSTVRLPGHNAPMRVHMKVSQWLRAVPVP